MPGDDGRTTEDEIALAVAKYLAKTPKGWADMAAITRHLTYNFPFTPADKEKSPSRPNEWIWEQQPRNIVSHRKAEGNYIREGLFIYEPGSLEITDKGRAHVAANGG